jgi:hypothetical protein
MFGKNLLHHLRHISETPVLFSETTGIISLKTDLLTALLDNGSINTFQHTRGQQYKRRVVFYVVRLCTIEGRCFLRDPRHATVEELCFLSDPCRRVIRDMEYR